MIILGLGSNLGDREALLREAIRRIGMIPNLTVTRVSYLYESDAMLLPDADPSWNIPYLNCNLAIKTSNSPEDILREAKRIEAEMGRHFGARWSPRPIDIDILQWDDLTYEAPTLNIPHIGLLQRPFALLPLADLYDGNPPLGKDVIINWQHEGGYPFNTRRIGRLYPQLVGILNVTPDSFSDGGQYQTLPQVVARVEELISEGASVIDVGAESTKPNATLISANEEWQRIEKILPSICEICKAKNILVSLDTRHPEVAQKASKLGINWLNDVSGCITPELINVLKESELKYVLTHSITIPPTKEDVLPLDCDVIKELISFAKEKIESLTQNGIARERILFDPGLGFGKTQKQNYEIVERAAELRQIGLPLFFGHSRKSFLQEEPRLPIDVLDEKTAQYSIKLADATVEYLRVHDVKHNRLLLQI